MSLGERVQYYGIATNRFSLDNSLSAIVHVLGVQVDWYRLGVQLKVPSQQLEVFRCHDPHLRIEEVLNFGLRSEERSPTGQILTDALKKMGHDSLAQRIHNLFAGSPGECIGTGITGV